METSKTRRPKIYEQVLNTILARVRGIGENNLDAYTYTNRHGVTFRMRSPEDYSFRNQKDFIVAEFKVKSHNQGGELSVRVALLKELRSTKNISNLKPYTLWEMGCTWYAFDNTYRFEKLGEGVVVSTSTDFARCDRISHYLDMAFYSERDFNHALVQTETARLKEVFQKEARCCSCCNEIYINTPSGKQLSGGDVQEVFDMYLNELHFHYINNPIELKSCA